MFRYYLLFSIFVLGMQLFGCEERKNINSSKETSTFKTIQEKIFNQKCISCHTSGTSYATESGLILTSDVAYNQLINVTPKNSASAKDGLVRVSNKSGQEALEKSFLFKKINAPDEENFYANHSDYGSIMPFGNLPLTNGEIEFIRQWIIMGAPEDGIVANQDLFNDITRYIPGEFIPLEKPANGIQLHLGPFAIAPYFERELFYYVPLNNTQDILVKRVEIKMRNNSHHFIMYTYPNGTPRSIASQPNVYRDIRNIDGTVNWNVLADGLLHRTFFSGTQWLQMNDSLPSDVALMIPKGVGLDLNSHYANYSNRTTYGEVYANIHFANSDEIKHIATVFSLSNVNIYLPPHQVTTLDSTFTFSERRYILSLFSHAHKHMTEFKAKIYAPTTSRHEELVYISTSWEHPPIVKFNPPLILEKGQGFTTEATYNNNTDNAIYFGLLSTDEMMILFGTYYKD